MVHSMSVAKQFSYDVLKLCGNFSVVQETDYDLETSLEGSEEDEYEGNKDAARALLRVKRKLDGYEEGEMRSVRGQVIKLLLPTS